jgi:hypothetical protein
MVRYGRRKAAKRTIQLFKVHMKTIFIASGLLLILLLTSDKKSYVSKTSGKVLDIRDFTNMRNKA